VLARRIIAVSPDKAFGKQLAVALRAAGGAVDAHASVEELGSGQIQAALVVVHLAEDASSVAARGLIERLIADTRLIAILPRSNLAAVVDLMQASARVAGLLVAEDFDSRQLSAMATRVLAGDIFGLEKLVPWGTQIHNALVGDYQEKSLCIAQVSELAETMGVRRKYREPMEQCLDEMLMNALYDAPVDEQGQQIFSEIPTKTRISLRVEQKVVVQYACDGKRFSIAVRDAFGTLERDTVLRYLHKCLHAEQQIDRKIGGAGLGLYLMTNSSTEVYFNVLPGVATEAVCVFDLEQPKLQLTSFGFFAEKIDAAGRLAMGEIRRLPANVSHPVERRAQPAASRRGVIAILLAAIAVVLGLVVMVVWTRLSGPELAAVAITTTPNGATLEIEGKHAGTTTEGGLLVRGLEIGRAYPVVARLEGHEPRAAIIQPRDASSAVTLELKALPATVVFESVPTGASVEIGGQPTGTTPLTLSSLPPGSTQEVRFAKPGYQPVVTQLAVPKAGKELHLVQPLAISADLARVMLVSDPPGASVIQNGQLLAGMLTPIEVLVVANKPVRFTLAMPGKVPAQIPAFSPSGLAERTVKLVDGAPVRVRASVTGTGSIAGAPHCQALPVPFECMLAPGRYVLELAPAQATRVVRRFVVATQPVDVALEVGFVEAGGTKQLLLGGRQVRRAAFEVGPRSVTIKDDHGTRTITVVVKAGATVVAN
jgi:hypothetical protein